ncbi:helix-turn-helix domain-containing protein [Paenibacillus psychroresistens]|uniref:helix-turn-helix domain-containing protein n=1 Tax=Paenibacillus psychroresistens TaxID=1778678 RepID=UPI0013908D91|nr:helix-turn-helix transcriptional regulator [Paenibacillus psychroresistens]
MGLGERIRELRISKNYTQDQLAEEIGMQRSNVAKYESNTNIPPVEVLTKLADKFKVSVDYLLGRVENSFDMFTDSSEESLAKDAKIKGYLEKSESLLRNGKEVDEQKLKEALNYLEYLFKKEDK